MEQMDIDTRCNGKWYTILESIILRHGKQLRATGPVGLKSVLGQFMTSQAWMAPKELGRTGRNGCGERERDLAWGCRREAPSRWLPGSWLQQHLGWKLAQEKRKGCHQGGTTGHYPWGARPLPTSDWPLLTPPASHSICSLIPSTVGQP